MDIYELRICFREDRFRLSHHAEEERGHARLKIDELREAGCRAELLSIDESKPGGTRYLLRGTTDLGRVVYMPVVLKENGIALVVSVYERKSKRNR